MVEQTVGRKIKGGRRHYTCISTCETKALLRHAQSFFSVDGLNDLNVTHRHRESNIVAQSGHRWLINFTHEDTLHLYAVSSPFGNVPFTIACKEQYAFVPSIAYEHPDIPYRLSPDSTRKALYKAGWTRKRANWLSNVEMMPSWASRLELKVHEMELKRVKDLTYKDVRSAGFIIEESNWYNTFVTNWNTFYHPRKYRKYHRWEHNPWIWHLRIEVINHSQYHDP